MTTIENYLKMIPNESLDFVPEIKQLSQFAQTIVAFANNKGGTILIGVNKKGKVVGVNPEPELVLIEETNLLLAESVQIIVTKHQVKHHFVIQVDVSKAETPIETVNEEAIKVFFYRIGNVTLEANKIITNYLMLKKHNKVVKMTALNTEVLSLFNNRALNLATLYKECHLKPKDVDGALAELLYLGRIIIEFKNNAFFYRK